MRGEGLGAGKREHRFHRFLTTYCTDFWPLIYQNVSKLGIYDAK
jgi:hypothetical protein